MGKVVASYLVRVTLRERNGETIEQWGAKVREDPESLPPTPIPSIDRTERILGDALVGALDYFTHDDIRVTAERLDR